MFDISYIKNLCSISVLYYISRFEFALSSYIDSKRIISVKNQWFNLWQYIFLFSDCQYLKYINDSSLIVITKNDVSSFFLF